MLSLISNTNNSIDYNLFVCTQLNIFKYCYLTLTIQLNTNHLFTQLNDEKVLFQTIQFTISHLFALSFKFIYQAVLFVNLGEMAIREYSTFSKAPALLEPHHQIVQYHIQDIYWRKDAVGVFYSPSQLGHSSIWVWSVMISYTVVPVNWYYSIGENKSTTGIPV